MKTYGWGNEGHTVAGLAAFCQIAEAIPEAATQLERVCFSDAGLCKDAGEVHRVEEDHRCKDILALLC